VTRQLSEADGRVTRRRDIQAHLRACADCRAFRDSIDSRRQDLTALSPLPAVAAASILHGLAGGGAATGATAGAGAATSGIGIGAGKVAAGSVALKAAATVAVVATVGVTAADRSNLIDAGLPGDSGGSAKKLDQDAGGAAPSVAPPAAAAAGGSAKRAGVAGQDAPKPAGATGPSGGSKTAAGSVPTLENPTAKGKGFPPGSPGELPEASRHGQETAAAHKKAGGSANSGKAHRNAASKAGHGASGKRHGPPAHASPPDHAQAGGTSKGKGKRDSAATTGQPEANPQPSKSEAQAGGTDGAEVTGGADQEPVTSP
jgi:hypothetical protein